MIKKLILVLFPVITFMSCGKDSNCPEITATAPASEVASLKSYLDANNIVATADDRGFFYNIAATGSGDRPNGCSGITVNYTGKLTNGVTFDDGTNSSFYLTQLITGWREGIPLIAPGGTITLYLPPSLGYGSTATTSIPANSILIFVIELKEVY